MIGDNIKYYRKIANLSQEELAIKLGVSRQSISLWEKGQTQPSIENIISLSKEFNVTADELINNNFNEQINEIALKNTENIDGILHNDINNKSIKNKKKIIIAVVTVIFILSIIFTVILLIFTTSFSDNTRAIAKAEESVVMISCYDYYGEEAATGSGFFLFDDKTIVTNYHVIEEAYTCKVSTEQDKVYDVDSVAYSSEEKDIAIITLKESTGIKPLKAGSAEKIKKGETVTAIGSPLGIKNSISQGILSGRITIDNIYVLQFTASISSGSSGGALFDNNGNVIDVTFASYEDGQNLNLAIPIEEVQNLYSNGKNTKKCQDIYLKKYPYVKYLNQYKDAIEVSFYDLKTNPEKYNKKLIKIIGYVASISSTYNDTLTYATYITNDINQTGFEEYIEQLDVGAFENNNLIRIINGTGYSFYKFQTKDLITVIGTFKYSKGDSYYSIFTNEICETYNTGHIDAKLMYKVEE